MKIYVFDTYYGTSTYSELLVGDYTIVSYLIKCNGVKTNAPELLGILRDNLVVLI